MDLDTNVNNVQHLLYVYIDSIYTYVYIDSIYTYVYTYISAYMQSKLNVHIQLRQCVRQRNVTLCLRGIRRGSRTSLHTGI